MKWIALCLALAGLGSLASAAVPGAPVRLPALRDVELAQVQCPPPKMIDPATGACICPAGVACAPNSCPPPKVMGANGQCVCPPATTAAGCMPPKCPPPKVMNADGRCVCPPGSAMNPLGECVRPCPPGMPRDPLTGLCVRAH